MTAVPNFNLLFKVFQLCQIYAKLDKYYGIAPLFGFIDKKTKLFGQIRSRNIAKKPHAPALKRAAASGQAQLANTSAYRSLSL